MNDYPWVGVDRWRNGEISTSLAGPLLVMLGFSVLLLVVSVPVMLSEWSTLVRQYRAWTVMDPSSFDPQLLLVVLPLIWLLTLKPLYRYWRRWQRFRGVSVTLDPYPGSVGGQVGGYVSVPLPWQADMPVDVRLNCARVSISGRGKNRSRFDKVHWRKRARAHATPSGRGETRIQFLVDVEDGLPSSDVEQKGSYTYWAIRVRLPGSDFDQSFEIPVFDTGVARDSGLRLPSGDAGSGFRSVRDIPGTVADVRENGRGFVIDLPPGRNGGLGTILTSVGFLLGMVAGFMWFQASQELTAEHRSYFALLVTTVIATGFSLFSVPLILGGLFVRTNRLTLMLEDDRLMIDRKAFGRHFKRSIGTADVHRLYKKVTAQSGQGAMANVHYAIKLETRAGRKISIADGIPGQENADALLDFLVDRIELQPEKADSPASAMPVPGWLPYALLVGKALSILLVIATLAAFVADFVFVTAVK